MTRYPDAPLTLHDDAANGRPASRWRIAAWSAAALFLLFPLVAMLFTDEVDWSVADFVFASALLLGVGLPLDLAVRKTDDPAYRWGAALALATALLLVSVNGAVGIIGAEDNDANVLFGGVLAVGVVGALLARFRPRGMARAMAATALAQAAVAVGALATGLVSPESDHIEIVALWGFVALWTGAAVLFRRAAREGPLVDAG